jgi:hypothetical protein
MKVKSCLKEDFDLWESLNEADVILGRDIVRMVRQLGELLDQNLPFKEIDEQISGRHGPNYAAYWQYVYKEISRFHPRGLEFALWRQQLAKKAQG